MKDEATGRAAGRRLEAEGEVATARLALHGDELLHAAEHLAGAAALDPSLPDTHEALAELAARAGGAEQALQFFPVEGDVFIGTVACHAHLCAVSGRWDDAVQLLAMVAATEPDRPWLDAVWMTRPDLADLVSPQAVAMTAARVGPQLPEPVPEDARGPLLPLLSLVRGAVQRHPRHPVLLWTASALARRIGDPAEAVEWARRSARIQPSHPASVMLGYALRRAGDSEGALRIWQQRLNVDPSDLDLHVDVAELLADIGRPADGVAWIDRALAVDPVHPKAAPAGHGLRFLVDGDIRHLVALVDLRRDHPDQEYAGTVLEQRSQGRDWLHAVPPGTEAAVGRLRQLLGKREPAAAEVLEVTVTALEPPSVTLALRNTLPLARTVVEAAPQPDAPQPAVPQPDPREPVRPVALQVWRYEGDRARPAVPAPSLAAARAVRDLAVHNWPHLPAAYDRAVRLSGLALEDLLGCMVHPPASGEDSATQLFGRYAPDLWVRSVQVWACLGVAHHRTDEPWAHSRRRETLADLLDGPEDWVCEAAALALVAVAWVQPDTRSDVAGLLSRRLEAAHLADRSREVTILPSLCRLALIAPGLAPEASALARNLLGEVAGPARPAQRRRSLWARLRRR